MIRTKTLLKATINMRAQSSLKKHSTTMKTQSITTSFLQETKMQHYIKIKTHNGYINVNNPIIRRYIKSRMTMNNLTDVWRQRNPKIRESTFDKMQAKNRTKAQLDHFLISRKSLNTVAGVSIGRTCAPSDHRHIHLKLVRSPVQRGKGFWRFNNNLLKDMYFLVGSRQDENLFSQVKQD